MQSSQQVSMDLYYSLIDAILIEHDQDIYTDHVSPDYLRVSAGRSTVTLLL